MKINQKNLNKNVFVWVVLSYPILMFLLFYVGVNANSILMAFQKYNFGEKPTWNGINNFIEFIKDIKGDKLMSISFSNSFKMYIITLITTVPLQLLFSYFLFKRFPGHGLIRFIVLLPSIISEFIICLVFKKFVEGALPTIMTDLLGYKTFPNLINDVKYTFGTTVFYGIWMSFTTSLIMYPNAMNEIPTELIESAHVDGIQTEMQELWYIILPLIFPTISTFLITGFTGILSATGPLVAFFMLNAPQPVFNMGYLYYVRVATASENLYPYLAAGGLLMTFIVAPLTFLLKYLLEKFGPEAEY